VSEIVLKDQGHHIRVTMNRTGHEPNGTACETLDILLDRSAQIKELLLNPVK